MLTVGGLDDGKAKRIGPSLYHSSYEAGGTPVKPEIAPTASHVQTSRLCLSSLITRIYDDAHKDGVRGL